VNLHFGGPTKQITLEYYLITIHKQVVAGNILKN